MTYTAVLGYIFITQLAFTREALASVLSSGQQQSALLSWVIFHKLRF